MIVTGLSRCTTSCMPGQSLEFLLVIGWWPHSGTVQVTDGSSDQSETLHQVCWLLPHWHRESKFKICTLTWRAPFYLVVLVHTQTHTALRVYTHSHLAVEAMSQTQRTLTQNPLEKTWVPWMKSRLSKRRGCEYTHLYPHTPPDKHDHTHKYHSVCLCFVSPQSDVLMLVH